MVANEESIKKEVFAASLQIVLAEFSGLGDNEHPEVGLFALAVCGETRPVDAHPAMDEAEISSEIKTSRTIDELRDAAFPDTSGVHPRPPDARFLFINKMIEKKDICKRLNYLYSQSITADTPISSSNIAVLFDISEEEAAGVCTLGKNAIGKNGKLPDHDTCDPLKQTPYNSAVSIMYTAFCHPTMAPLTPDGYRLLRINRDVHKMMKEEAKPPDAVIGLFRALSVYSRLVMLQKYPSLQPAVLRYTVTAQVGMSEDDKHMTAWAYAVFDTLTDGMACVNAKDKRILLELAFYFVGRHMMSASYGAAVAENVNFSCVLFQILVVLSDYTQLWNKNDAIEIGSLPAGLKSPDKSVTDKGIKLVEGYIGRGMKITCTPAKPPTQPWYECFGGRKTTPARKLDFGAEAGAEAKTEIPATEQDTKAEAEAEAGAKAEAKAEAEKKKKRAETEEADPEIPARQIRIERGAADDDDNRGERLPARRRTVRRSSRREPRKSKGKKREKGRRRGGGADSPSSSSSSSRASSHDSVSSDTEDEDDNFSVQQLKIRNHALRKEIREVLLSIKNTEFTVGRKQAVEALVWQVSTNEKKTPESEREVNEAVTAIRKFGYEMNDMSGIVPSVSTTAHSKLAALLEKTKTVLQTVVADACAGYDKILLPYNARKCTGPVRWDDRNKRHFYCSFNHFKWDVIRDDVHGFGGGKKVTLWLCDKHKHEFQQLPQFTVITIGSTQKTGLHAVELILGL